MTERISITQMKNSEMNENALISDKYKVISDNLSRHDKGFFNICQIYKAYIREFALTVKRRILNELDYDNSVMAFACSDTAEKIIRKAVKDVLCVLPNEFVSDKFLNVTQTYCLMYFCGCLSEFSDMKDIETVSKVFLQSEGKPIQKSENKKIVLLKSIASIKAFEKFAKTIYGAEPIYGDDFQSMCEGLSEGVFSVIPIFNTSDGRLNGLYKLLEKYELNIVLATDIPSSDGESNTRFALVSHSSGFVRTDGKTLMEVRITFEGPSYPGDIANASSYFGINLLRADPLPYSFSGRENSYSFSFDISNADCAGFLCYLRLRYPQFNISGIYTLV